MHDLSISQECIRLIYHRVRIHPMNNLNRAVGPANSSARAVMLVTVMVLASLGPILSSPVVSAHETANGNIWPMEGSEDTGWVLLNATGADAVNGTQASADWMLNFAPGAILGNVSMGYRAYIQEFLFHC